MFSLPSGLLDDVGFNFIKKCISAIETRGKILSKISHNLEAGQKLIRCVFACRFNGPRIIQSCGSQFQS